MNRIFWTVLFFSCIQSVSAASLTLSARSDQATSQVIVEISSPELALTSTTLNLLMQYWTVKSDGSTDYATTFTDVLLPSGGSSIVSSSGPNALSIQTSGRASSSGVIASLKFSPTSRGTLPDGTGTFKATIVSATTNGVAAVASSGVQLPFAFTSGSSSSSYPPPTSVSAVAGDGQATVSWVSPANKPEPIFSYRVISSPGSLGCSFLVFGSDSSCSVIGLQNGISYTFIVMAQYLDGISPASAPSNAVTPRAATPTPVPTPTPAPTPTSAAICGSASYSVASSDPTALGPLCLIGAASRVSSGEFGTFAWSCTGSNVANCSTLPFYPAPNVTLNVVLPSAAMGAVTSDPPGISYAPLGKAAICPDGSSVVCGTAGSYQFTKNQTVTLTATTVSGSKFNGWGGGCTGKKPVCKIKIKKNTTVTAKFK